VGAWRLFLAAGDLSDPDTPRLLSSAGVRFVIVHPSMYAEGPIPALIKRYYEPQRSALAFAPPRNMASGLRLLLRMEDALVYEIEPASQPVGAR
jgi:hypothetical protein